MALKTIRDVDLKGKTILYRAPYDIEPKEINGAFVLADDMRISATLPTLEYLLKENCKIVVLTYVGRPDGKVVENLRTNLHAQKLSELLKRPVMKVDDCIGEEVEAKIAQMAPGDILMLENVRFHSEEMVDDDALAAKLCQGKDLIVFDGFPQAHRMHSSTTGIERHLPAVAGLYLEREVNMLTGLLKDPKKPFVVIIGGAKISDKVDAITNLLKIADTVLVGGAVSSVFLKAEGREMGSSFIEDVFVDKVKREKKDWVEDAKSILEQAQSLGKKIITPRDLLISDGTEVKVINILEEAVPAGWMAYDIGPVTQLEFVKVITEARTVFINGPMGKFEDERFKGGSCAVLFAMEDLTKNHMGETIIAGGDTIEVARRCSNIENYSHLSLAGGATLEFLAGHEMPALKALLR